MPTTKKRGKGTTPAQRRQHLARSRLHPQAEVLADDLKLDALNIRVRGKGSINIVDAVLDGSINRTIDGASTLELDVADNDGRMLLKSGFLTSASDINIDGLWFRLVKVVKDGETYTLTFEDREIAILRTYNSYKRASRDEVTRAEFVLSLINEVKEFQIPIVIPELHQQQKVAKVPETQGGSLSNLGGGLIMGDDLTIKGQKPDATQLKNLSIALSVGASMNMSDLAMRACIVTCIQESQCYNLKGGDRDSVGMFQQRATWGTYNQRRNIEYAARKFFEGCQRVIREAGPSLKVMTAAVMAQAVQISAFPDAYSQWIVEARKILGAFSGIEDASPFAGDESMFVSGDGEYFFERGTMTDGRLKKEGSWTAIQRMASEVGWRSFFRSGTFYYVSEQRLFKSKPAWVFSESTDGVDSIDFDYDIGKKQGEVTVNLNLSRWKMPPGVVVKIQDMGPIDGRWLVTSIRRGLFDTTAEVTIKKPVPKLPEPAATAGSEDLSDFGMPGDETAFGGDIADAAKRALSMKQAYAPYRQVRPYPDSLFPPTPGKIDCSAFAILCYKAAGAKKPGGGEYDGTGNTDSMVRNNGIWTTAPSPGDLAFYGSSKRNPSHVAVFIGNGECIGYGSTPIRQHKTNYRSDFLGYMTYLREQPGHGGPTRDPGRDAG